MIWVREATWVTNCGDEVLVGLPFCNAALHCDGNMKLIIRCSQLSTKRVQRGAEYVIYAKMFQCHDVYVCKQKRVQVCPGDFIMILHINIYIAFVYIYTGDVYFIC